MSCESINNAPEQRRKELTDEAPPLDSAPVVVVHYRAVVDEKYKL